MDRGLERLERALERPGRQPVDCLERGRPRDPSRRQHPFPCPEAAGFQRQSQALVALAQRALDALGLPDQRRDRQRGHRHRTEEELQEQQAAVGRHHREWPEAGAGAAHGDGGDQHEQRGGLARPEAEGGPDQRRQTQERQRIVRRTRDEVAKHARRDQRADPAEEQRLQRAIARADGPGRLAAKGQKQKRRDHEIAGRVAEPPREPDGARVRPVRVAAEHERADADGGADRRAEQRGRHHELEDVLRAIEGRDAAGEALDERRADERLQRVAGGDAERRQHRARGADVDEEGAREDHRPDAAPEQQHGDQRDARGRPHGRRVRVDARERQAQLAGDEIEDADAERGGEPDRPPLHCPARG